MAGQQSVVGDVRTQPNHIAGAHGSLIIVFLLRFIRPFYYIGMSVSLENIPLVKFIKTTSGTRVVYFP